MQVLPVSAPRTAGWAAAVVPDGASVDGFAAERGDHEEGDPCETSLTPFSCPYPTQDAVFWLDDASSDEWLAGAGRGHRHDDRCARQVSAAANRQGAGPMTQLRSAPRIRLVASAFVAASTQSSLAGFTTFYDDHEGWSDAAGDFATVDFVFPTAQLLSDQYASLGLHFTDGDDVAYAAGGYEDGWGAMPNGPVPPIIRMEFDEPQYAFAIKFPGISGFTLLSGGTAIWSGAWSGTGSKFLGVISTLGFDEVHLTSPVGQVKIDDIYFSSNIPAPAGVVVFAGLLLGRRRRS